MDQLTNYKKKNASFLTIITILLIMPYIAFAEKVSIKGLDISYNEITQVMTASGNAELNHPDFTIYADQITYNQKTNQVIGRNNVEMIQQNQIIFSDKFMYNTKSNIILIDNLTIELTSKLRNQQIYVSATSFSDNQSYKKGKMGIITTCDYNPPHYYLHAESFTIYPEKRVVGQNVTLVNPVFFIPLGFWSPAYIFDLGKRKVIYLMPVMGSNRIEGSFIKSQVDYVLSDHWTGEAYIDYLSKKGTGLGTRLNYNNFDNLDGNLYYYSVTDTDDFIKEWNQTVKITDNESLTTHIQERNIYLINGGYYSKDQNKIDYEKETINTTYKTSYSYDQSKLSSIKPKTYKLNYSQSSDDKSNLNIDLSKHETSIEKEEVSVRNSSYIGHDILSTNQINYNQQDLSSTDSRKESYLKTENSVKKTFKDFGTVTTTINYYFDTDSDTVTSDIKNHIVQKTPEINLQLNKKDINENWSINQDFQYGYYTELYYKSDTETQREYEQSRVNINQSLTGNYDYTFLDGNLTFNTSYNQYLYASGDQTYTLGNTTKYTTDSFSFLKTETSHTQTWAPENGNTPFYFDERDQMEKNEIKESITLYYLNPEKYALKYSSGYNWIVDYQLDNQFELKINPTPQIRTLFKTTYLIQQRKYSTLVNRFDYIPSTMFSTSVQANYDLNIGEMINLNHTLTGSTSKHWENRWIFNAYFTYAPKYEQDYQLQTLSLTKDLHERQLTFMYNRIIEEYRFQFTINAMPENKVGFTSNKFESRLEGIFDDTSIQR